MSDRRVVAIADLDELDRRLVLALIAAQRAANETAAQSTRGGRDRPDRLRPRRGASPPPRP